MRSARIPLRWVAPWVFTKDSQSQGSLPSRFALQKCSSKPAFKPAVDFHESPPRTLGNLAHEPKNLPTRFQPLLHRSEPGGNKPGGGSWFSAEVRACQLGHHRQATFRDHERRGHRRIGGDLGPLRYRGAHGGPMGYRFEFQEPSLGHRTRNQSAFGLHGSLHPTRTPFGLENPLPSHLRKLRWHKRSSKRAIDYPRRRHPGCLLRLVWRHSGPRIRYQSRMGRDEDLLGDRKTCSRFLCAQRGYDLCRQPDPTGTDSP